jgi:hypothetical protein
MMILVTPGLCCFSPGLSCYTRSQVPGHCVPAARLLGAIVAASQAKRDQDEARADEANHGEGMGIALDLTRCSSRIQSELQQARSIQKDFK